MARVPVLGKYLKKIQILENRISCDCNKVKLEIESKICQELWQLFFNGKYYGKTVTEDNLDSIEEKLKNRLRYEFNSRRRLVLLECSLNISKLEIDKFAILIHEKPTNQSERLRRKHESIHYDGIMKILTPYGCLDHGQVIKVSVVLRDHAYYDQNDVAFLDDDELVIED